MKKIGFINFSSTDSIYDILEIYLAYVHKSKNIPKEVVVYDSVGNTGEAFFKSQGTKVARAKGINGLAHSIVCCDDIKDVVVATDYGAMCPAVFETVKLLESKGMNVVVREVMNKTPRNSRV